VNRAWAVVAVDDFLRDTAGLATVSRLDKGTSLCVSTRTAGHAASSTDMIGIHIPCTLYTVNGTSERVTRLHSGRCRAILTAEAGFLDRANTPLHTGRTVVASLGTGRPLSPSTDDAIDRASLAVAVTDVLVTATRLAAVLWLGEATGSGLGTTATRLGATSPFTPSKLDAVDRAIEGVAVLFGGFNIILVSFAKTRYWTGDTAIGRSDKRPGGLLNTSAARLAASGPVAPCADIAVHGAIEFVAVLRFKSTGTGLAAELRFYMVTGTRS